ncbi:unnamed protein product [Pleuronectes platessa]|uniref:Uncharacterized protein n=1 Tax=Pleuronectes platessa TaxID=8262 RepID=A0A9N7TSZ0_PLEPL|nr:unnamed protein product [Pleuronectes platessa]
MHIIRPVSELANEWGRSDTGGGGVKFGGRQLSFLSHCKVKTSLQRGSLTQIPMVKETRVESGQFLLLSVLCMLFILVALAVSATFFCVRQRSHLHMKEKLASLGTDTSTDATATYQGSGRGIGDRRNCNPTTSAPVWAPCVSSSGANRISRPLLGPFLGSSPARRFSRDELCRQRMAIRTSERVERPETLRHSRLNSVSSQFSDGPAASPSTRSSTSSWCEEPVPSNMDISTGHMILVRSWF